MDVYFKKEIPYSFQGEKFTFAAANTLFSTSEIDHGTDVLLRSIVTNSPKTILDVGCGYGPIGIVLAKKNPQAQVTLIDYNLLAVRYSRENIKRNGVPNATVLGSVGLEAILDKTYDLIVSNIPAKIGDEAIAQDFILIPYEHLTLGGELWIVAVNALNRLIPRVGRKHELNMKEIKKKSGHSVYRIRKPL
ncbi:MAG TPA: methyltransferase [Patescibacteria group bacterium]|nr:methyltransferase [Patescibacteria group bacterium]